MRSTPKITALAVALVLSAATCDQPLGVLPHIDGELALPHTAMVTGSVPVTYLFEIPASTPVNFHLQGTSGNAADSLVALVRTQVGNVELGRVATDGAAPGPLVNRVFIGGFPTTVRLAVEVRGVRATDAGPFVLTASPIATGILPESADDSLRIGVKVTEEIEHPDDVDGFRLWVDAGERIIVFIGRFGVPAPSELRVLATTADGTIVHQSSVTSRDHDTWARSIVFEPPTGTMYTLRVALSAGNLPSAWSTGAYQLLPIPIPRAPETASPTVSRGDTLAESVDIVGDVDEFTLTTGPNEDFRVALALEQVVQHPAKVTVLRNGLEVASFSTSVPPDGDAWPQTATIPSDQTGTFVVRVESAAAGTPDSLLTPYRLAVFPNHRDPEAVPHTLTSGVTVVGESVDYLGDIDDFRIAMTAGQRFSAKTVGQVRTFLVDPGNVVVGEIVSNEVFEPGFRATFSAGVAPSTGTYRVRIVGRGQATEPYELTFFALDTLPETVPTEIPFNTWIETEGFEDPADIDRYSFTMPPDAGFIRLRTAAGTIGGGLVSGSGTGINSFGFDEWTLLNLNRGPVRLPGGTAGFIRLSGITWTADLSGPGTYRLQVELLDTSPESLPATATLGDTVQGESIDLVGDLDEFRVFGTPGQPVTVWFEGPAPVCFSQQTLRLDTYADTTLLARQWSTFPASGTTAATMPASGMLSLVVQSSKSGAPECFTGPYRFAVTPVP